MSSLPEGKSTVVPLRAGRSEAAPETLELVAALRAMALELLGGRLTRMFDGADDLLFEFAERAANNQEQRLYFDTMRTVRLGRPEMLQRFSDVLVAGFDAPVSSATLASPDTDEADFTLRDPGTLERDIAIANMAGKAEGLYKQALWEIARKFGTLVEGLKAPMSVEALAPATLCRAFRAGAEALDVELGVELVIYKLFDRLVIGELGELYAQTLYLLKQHGVQGLAAPRATSRDPRSSPGVAGSSSSGPSAPIGSANAGPLSGAAAAPAPDIVGPSALPGWSQAMASIGGSFGGGFGPVAGQPGDRVSSGRSRRRAGQNAVPEAAPYGVRPSHAAAAGGGPAALDAQTLAALTRLEAADRAASVYGNGQLAADLASAASGQQVAGWTPPQAAAYVQRTGLVGRMFNQIIADPQLPRALHEPFDALRVSVIKAALGDESFLADPGHPVRNLVNELAMMAVAARTAESETLARIQALVDEIRGQFEIAAESIRKPTADVRPLDADRAGQFVEQQARQTELRRLATVKKVRRIVAEELQLRTLGIALPLSVRPLIYSAWAPMMSVYLLREGPESEEWRSGLALLERILAALDPASGAAPDAPQRDALFQALRQGLTEVGLADARIEQVLDGFAKALDERPAPAAATGPTQPAPSAVAKNAAGLPTMPAEDNPTALRAPSGKPSDHKALLDLLIVPGNWFRVFDRDRQTSRWLKAVALYKGMDCAAFAEFNGKNTLLVKSGQLLDDMAARRAEPLDLPPTARRAMQSFFAAVAPGTA